MARRASPFPRLLLGTCILFAITPMAIPHRPENAKDRWYKVHHNGSVAEPHAHVTQRLRRHPLARRVHEQHHLVRERRQDPLYDDQWYITSNTFPSLQVHSSWEADITGRDVVVTIVDDGVEHTNDELNDNYDPAASYDYNDDDADPIPRYGDNDLNKHGTRCAGVVAGEHNNGRCGSGIAYDVNLGGIRMLDGPVLDSVEGASLSFNPQYVDIYSASWGPSDDGRTMEGPGPLAVTAFASGVKYGRGGLGSIYVWAGGNGGISASTFSSYSTGYYNAIVSADLHNRCTEGFSGTSAAAPQASGIIALLLQAKPCLSWIDVQDAVAYSADPSDLVNGDFQTTGSGLRFSHYFGFGLLRADTLLAWAENLSLPSALNAPIYYSKRTTSFALAGTQAYRVTLPLCTPDNSPCHGTMTFVQVHLEFSSQLRGQLSVTLTSPMGTQIVLLTKRSRDRAAVSNMEWTLGTSGLWGESPEGDWVLSFDAPDSAHITIHSWQLIVHGRAPPEALAAGELVTATRTLLSRRQVECVSCPEHTYPDGTGHCRQCAANCTEGCYGGWADMCIEANGDVDYQGVLLETESPPAWQTALIVAGSMALVGAAILFALDWYKRRQAVARVRRATHETQLEMVHTEPDTGDRFDSPPPYAAIAASATTASTSLPSARPSLLPDEGASALPTVLDHVPTADDIRRDSDARAAALEEAEAFEDSTDSDSLLRGSHV
ncbi:uncharacterized protein MONBRDRAFT_30798 [Monosiga brevicollis MX1]|uniref:P/Homo B domain-containing protein n=1 Tax=Monosiga brevicollis TaxID=81824 RepID=A9UPB2_MONBE|nr:uncharacterized protein MONBRDRAFT_30798 [Monosiga brevicollis MX1]EDQ92387.1 predicted protein [Monosiga brevicollis MX1]|eukprot:XP_001742149.1 hypothetical protein [Monosiga brevicollis MX1]